MISRKRRIQLELRQFTMDARAGEVAASVTIRGYRRANVITYRRQLSHDPTERDSAGRLPIHLGFQSSWGERYGLPRSFIFDADDMLFMLLCELKYWTFN